MTRKIDIQFLQKSIAYTSDQEAYKHLFYYFHPLLRRFATNMLHNNEVAEEIVSDVLLKVWTMREGLALIEDLKLYLFKATKNACLNYLNSATYKNSLKTYGTEQHEELSIAPDAEYLQTEMQQVILKTVEQLPPKCQLVFKLIKENGLTHRQVGQLLEISQNTIETHIRLALKKLKLVLDQYMVSQK